jgi:predicted nucleic acid-binding protein
MRVVDTSAWIEWQSGSALGQKLSVEMPPDREWLVPTVVQFELTRWALRELPRERLEAVIGFSNTLIVQSLNSGLATVAAEYAAQHSLSMADAIIYATAMKFGADLLTCDAHFANLPGVVYFPKTAP